MKLFFQKPERAHLGAELLSAYLDHQVTPDERARVDAHLTACAACRSELESLRATASLLHALPRIPTPRAFTLSEAQAGIRRKENSFAWGGLLRGFGAVAAVALVAFVAASLLRQPSGGPGGMVAFAPQPAAVEPAATTAGAAESRPVAPPTEVAPASAVEKAVVQPPAPALAPAAAAPTVEPAPAALAAAPQSTAAADTREAASQPAVAAKIAATPTQALVAAAAAPVTPEAGAMALGLGGGAGAAAALPDEALTPEPLPAAARVSEVLPAGARLVYADLKTLWAIDRTAGTRQLAAADALNTPLLSSDQTWVAYRVIRSDYVELWAIPWEGGAPRLLLDEHTLPKEGLDADHSERRVSDVRWVPGKLVLALNLVAVASPNASAALPKLELWNLDLETGALRYVSDLEQAYRPFYSPNGARFATLQYGSDGNAQGRLTVADADGGNRRVALQFAASPAKLSYDTQLTWLPDSSALLLALPDADSLQPGQFNGTTLYRVAGSAQVIGRVDAYQVAWSPDGGRLAFTRITSDDMVEGELYLADGDGRSAKLYATVKNGAFLSWSPDGTHFLYQDNYQTYLGALGQAPQRLGTGVSFVNPTWVSNTQFVSQHDTGAGWVLTLRGTDGAAYSLLPLPREAMLDVAHR